MTPIPLPFDTTLSIILQGGALTSPVDQWLAAACNPRGRLKVRRRVVAPGLHGLVAAEGIMKGDLILEVPSKLSIKAEEVQTWVGCRQKLTAGRVSLQ